MYYEEVPVTTKPDKDARYTVISDKEPVADNFEFSNGHWFFAGENIDHIVYRDFTHYLRPVTTPAPDGQRDFIERSEELWDKYSEHIDDDIMSLESVAGSSILKQRDYTKLIIELAALSASGLEREKVFDTIDKGNAFQQQLITAWHILKSISDNPTETESHISRINKFLNEVTHETITK